MGGPKIPSVLRHRTAQAAVAHELRVEILTGELSPGTRLRQASVAERMQTSTTPVREALRQLAAEGLLDMDPHRGVVVHQPTDEELEEVYEIRGVLEPLSIRKTVRRITDDEIADAEKIYERAHATADAGEWAIHNRDFHAALADGSRSPELSALLRNLRNRSAMYVAISLRGSPEHIAESNHQHRELLDAVVDRDEERAVDIVCRHLQQTVDLGHRFMDGAPEEEA